MCSRPTETRSRIAVKIGTRTSATTHFDRSVCQRLMGTGIRCLHFGPISVMP